MIPAVVPVSSTVVGHQKGGLMSENAEPEGTQPPPGAGDSWGMPPHAAGGEWSAATPPSVPSMPFASPARPRRGNLGHARRPVGSDVLCLGRATACPACSDGASARDLADGRLGHRARLAELPAL